MRSLSCSVLFLFVACTSPSHTVPVDPACEADGTGFPTFDKTCSTVSDCTIVHHQLDCCGSREALGIANSAVPTFDAAETACEAESPACECAEAPEVAEDGRNTLAGTIAVECSVHSCMTFIE
jgi:hypothetical protein